MSGDEKSFVGIIVKAMVLMILYLSIIFEEILLHDVVNTSNAVVLKLKYLSSFMKEKDVRQMLTVMNKFEENRIETHFLNEVFLFILHTKNDTG